MGHVLGTAWALPGEGADAIRGTVAEPRGPARPGLHGADGRGWPARCGCRKVPGTRLASGTPTSDTQKPDSPSQGQNVPAPRAPHPLPVTTSLLRNAHGHVARQPDASVLLSFSRLPAAPARPSLSPLPPSSADAPSELLGEAGALQSHQGPRGTWGDHGGGACECVQGATPNVFTVESP